MAMYNADGTQVSAETIAEILNDRFDAEQHPYLSDLLGSDWGVNIRKGEDRKHAAYRIARRIYPDDGGHLAAFTD